MRTAASNQDTPRRASARAEFLNLDFDLLDMVAAETWLAERQPNARFAYIVTPNVDHMIRLDREQGAVRDAYLAADLCLCDSRVLAAIARRCGVRLTVVPGSDLVQGLFTRIAKPGDVVSVIGGTETLIGRLRGLYPHLVVRHHLAPMNLRHDLAAQHAAAEAAREHAARFVLLAVGSPQQEIIASLLKALPDARGTALCIGAGVDFVTGAQRRAPKMMQRAGLEWAWRLAGSPRRLWRRYLIDGPRIFMLSKRWRNTADLAKRRR